MKDFCCQSTSPEMRACSTPLMVKISLSFTGSLETFHQKPSPPGPVITVCTMFEPLFAFVPVRAASVPSCVTICWPTHGEPVFVAQTSPAPSSAAASETSGVMFTNASSLVSEPEPLDTMSAYAPLRAGCAFERTSVVVVAPLTPGPSVTNAPSSSQKYSSGGVPMAAPLNVTRVPASTFCPTGCVTMDGNCGVKENSSTQPRSCPDLAEAFF